MGYETQVTPNFIKETYESMTTSLKAFSTLALLLTLAGCSGGSLPNSAPGTTTTGSTTTTTPTTTTTTTTTPTTTTGSPSTGGSSAAACTRPDPTDFTVGIAEDGDYNNQKLPKDWTFVGQDKIDTAIDGQYGGPNWACFQKFYPGATTVYKNHRGY